MKLKKAFLLLNGEKPKKLPDLSKYDMICATDGAYHFLEKLNIVPDLVSGDFDSINDLPTDVETIHTPNQDFTDFDKILLILFEKNFTKVDVYGASGGEQDHFLGNLHTAISFKNKLEITFFDNYSTFFAAKNTNEFKVKKGNIISLVPLPIAKKITTTGLQYSLKKEDLAFGKKIGTRNKALSTNIKIEFTEGDLFIFIENKENE